MPHKEERRIMLSAIERSPQFYARLAGAFYLAIIVFGAFGELAVRGSLIVPGDPAATASAIAGSPQLWRWGIVGDLTMHVFDLPVIVILYVLLRRMNRDLAIFATIVNVVQTAVLALNKLILVVPILLISGVDVADAPKVFAGFSNTQLQSLSFMAIQLHSYGFGIGLIFFGVACLARGVLIYRSGFFPKFLGAMVAAAGVAYLINSVALLAAPKLASVLFPAILLPPLFGETAFALWLIVKGVDPSGWASRADGSTN
jgi:Domain of unknown function (DUF4386)